MKNILRRASIQAALGVAAMAAACGGAPATTTPLSDTQGELGDSKPKATEEDEVGGKNPFVKALDDLHLKPEQQRAVDKLRAEAQQRHRPVREAKGALLKAMADAVERGQLDECALGSEVKQLVSAKAEASKGDRHALEQLHEILTPDQRVKFADALASAAAAHKAAHQSGAMLDKIADELDLSDAQKANVGKIIDATKSIREADLAGADISGRWTKIVNAFKTDCFALDKIAPACDVQNAYKMAIDDMIDATQHVVEILDKKQDKRLANLLREKAADYGEAEQGGANQVGQAGGGFGQQGVAQPRPAFGVGVPNAYGAPNTMGYGQPGAGVPGQPVGYGQQTPGAPEESAQQGGETGCAPGASEERGEQAPVSNEGEAASADEDLGIHAIAAGIGACAKDEGTHD